MNGREFMYDRAVCLSGQQGVQLVPTDASVSYQPGWSGDINQQKTSQCPPTYSAYVRQLQNGTASQYYQPNGWINQPTSSLCPAHASPTGFREIIPQQQWVYPSDACSQQRVSPQQIVTRHLQHCSDNDGSSATVEGCSAPVRPIRRVKLPHFTGSGESWRVWHTRFEDVALQRSWSSDDKLDELLPRLRGQAADFVFGQLRKKVRQSYRRLVKELSQYFNKVETNSQFIAEFQHRVQKLTESVQSFAHDLKRLYCKAYPHRYGETRDEDLLLAFLGGLHDDEVRLLVEFSKRPSDIDTAVEDVTELLEARSEVGINNSTTCRRVKRLTYTDSESDIDEDANETTLNHKKRKLENKTIDAANIIDELRDVLHDVVANWGEEASCDGEDEVDWDEPDATIYDACSTYVGDADIIESVGDFNEENIFSTSPTALSLDVKQYVLDQCRNIWSEITKDGFSPVESVEEQTDDNEVELGEAAKQLICEDVDSDADRLASELDEPDDCVRLKQCDNDYTDYEDEEGN